MTTHKIKLFSLLVSTLTTSSVVFAAGGINGGFSGSGGINQGGNLASTIVSNSINASTAKNLPPGTLLTNVYLTGANAQFSLGPQPYLVTNGFTIGMEEGGIEDGGNDGIIFDANRLVTNETNPSPAISDDVAHFKNRNPWHFGAAVFDSITSTNINPSTNSFGELRTGQSGYVGGAGYKTIPPYAYRGFGNFYVGALESPAIIIGQYDGATYVDTDNPSILYSTNNQYPQMVLYHDAQPAIYGATAASKDVIDFPGYHPGDPYGFTNRDERFDGINHIIQFGTQTGIGLDIGLTNSIDLGGGTGLFIHGNGTQMLAMANDGTAVSIGDNNNTTGNAKFVRYILTGNNNDPLATGDNCVATVTGNGMFVSPANASPTYVGLELGGSKVLVITNNASARILRPLILDSGIVGGVTTNVVIGTITLNFTNGILMGIH